MDILIVTENPRIKFLLEEPSDELSSFPFRVICIIASRSVIFICIIASRSAATAYWSL